MHPWHSASSKPQTKDLQTTRTPQWVEDQQWWNSKLLHITKCTRRDLDSQSEGRRNKKTKTKQCEAYRQMHETTNDRAWPANETTKGILYPPPDCGKKDPGTMQTYGIVFMGKNKSEQIGAAEKVHTESEITDTDVYPAKVSRKLRSAKLTSPI